MPTAFSPSPRAGPLIFAPTAKREYDIWNPRTARVVTSPQDLSRSRVRGDDQFRFGPGVASSSSSSHSGCKCRRRRYYDALSYPEFYYRLRVRAHNWLGTDVKDAAFRCEWPTER